MEKNNILMHNRVLCIHCEKFRSLLSLERDAIMMRSCISGNTLCVVECCHRSGRLFSAATCAVFLFKLRSIFHLIWAAVAQNCPWMYKDNYFSHLCLHYIHKNNIKYVFRVFPWCTYYYFQIQHKKTGTLYPQKYYKIRFQCFLGVHTIISKFNIKNWLSSQ